MPRKAPPHLQDGCSCVMDGQDVGDVVPRQQLRVSSIYGKEESGNLNNSHQLKPNLSFFFFFFYPRTTPPPPPPPEMSSKQMWLHGFKSFALVFNWKKNRKTNVSKTVQQLGPKARNSNGSNQILFFKRKPNVLYVGQMCFEQFFLSHALQVCRMLMMPPRQDQGPEWWSEH